MDAPDVLNAVDLSKPRLVGNVAWRAACVEFQRTFAVASSAVQLGNLNQIVAFNVPEGCDQIGNEVVALSLAVGAADRCHAIILRSVA